MAERWVKVDSTVHVGYIVPFDYMFANQNISFCSNAYLAMLYFKDKHQKELSYWYKQRKNMVKQGFLRTIHKPKDSVMMEMDVDGDRIEVPRFAYKCEQTRGFIKYDKLTNYKEEHMKKKPDLTSLITKQQQSPPNPTSCNFSCD